MALILKDRVLETCTAPGTGTVSLLGAVVGYQTFLAGVGNTNTCYYTIADQSGANYEVGIGTYTTSTNTLARTTVLASSNGGSLTNFNSGTQNVFVTYPASKSVYLDASDNVQPTLAGAVITGGTINSTSIGATTASTGAFTTLTTSSTVTLNGGTANGVSYLNGSKVLTSGSALTFDGTTLTGSASASTTGNFRATSSSAQVFNLTASNDAGTSIGFGVFGSSAGVVGMIGAGQPLIGTSASDLNIYNNNASGVIKFGIGSSVAEQMRLTSTGLGIGTSSPSARLHVTSSAASNYGAIIYNTSATGEGLTVRGGSTSSHNALVVQDYNGANALLAVQGGGNVGIGTSSPAVKLDVSGAGRFNTSGEALTVGASTLAANTAQYFRNTSGYGVLALASASDQYLTGVVAGDFVIGSNAKSLRFGNASTGALAATIGSTGNVGIGTSSLDIPLRVVKDWVSGQATIGAQSVTSYASGGLSGFANFDSNSIRMGNFYSTSTGTYVGTSNSAPLIIETNGAEKARINSAGNLLVGTTSVFGSARATIAFASGNSALALQALVNSGTANMVYFADIDNDTCGTITINATANTTAYNTSSDYRLKQNVEPITGALEKVSALNPVIWKWKHAPEIYGQGFIAHELQAVVPECVTGEKDAVDADGKPQYQGIDTSFLVATLTASIQELKAIVDAQAVRISQLENK